MIVKIKAAAYALSCTAGMGLLNWKNTASGKVAAGCPSEVGILSVYPAVNSTAAASPMARPIESRVAVAIPGAICRTTTLIVSSRVAPSEYPAAIPWRSHPSTG